MSFSLSRPRKHPRRHSVSWRSLGWLIEREAAWQILCKREGYTLPPWTRRTFCYSRRYVIRRFTERMLDYHPERRYAR